MTTDEQACQNTEEQQGLKPILLARVEETLWRRKDASGVQHGTAKCCTQSKAFNGPFSFRSSFIIIHRPQKSKTYYNFSS